MVIIFRTFSCLTKFLFHHKWSKAWLLDPRPKKGPIKSLLSVCLSLRPSVQSFSQIWLIILSDFWHNGRKLEYLKTDKVLFSKKIHFWRNLSKQDPKWSQNFFFIIFWKILSLVFHRNNLKWKLLLLLTFHHHFTRFWFWSYGPKCYQPIKLQDFLKCSVSEKKWMMKGFFGMQINKKVDKSSAGWYYDFGCVQPGMPKVPKIKNLHIVAISPKKHGGWSWFYACKWRQMFSASINLGLHSHACLKHPKQISLQYLSNISRKPWRMNLIIYLQVNVNGFFKFPLSF